MNASETELSGEIERAWTAFRARLADRLAALEDDDLLHLEVQVGVDEDELEGAAPYLQLVGWGGDLIRAEAVGNAFLDERFLLGDAAQGRLTGWGWLAPTHGPDDEGDAGSPHFHVDLERRDADRLAVMVVGALRDAYGCTHPAFLEADGLEVDPQRAPLPAPVSAPAAEELEEPLAVFPRTGTS